jgi:methylated-DNA-protein-cysteine methyltransferase related protein
MRTRRSSRRMVAAFTRAVVDVMFSIPRGRVITYGAVAVLAGSPRGARQVVRVLHTQSRKEGLPWFRVVNAQGRIAITDPTGADLQRSLLEAEGVVFGPDGRIDLDEFMWDGIDASGRDGPKPPGATDVKPS